MKDKEIREIIQGLERYKMYARFDEVTVAPIIELLEQNLEMRELLRRYNLADFNKDIFIDEDIKVFLIKLEVLK